LQTLYLFIFFSDISYFCILGTFSINQRLNLGTFWELYKNRIIYNTTKSYFFVYLKGVSGAGDEIRTLDIYLGNLTREFKAELK